MHVQVVLDKEQPNKITNSLRSIFYDQDSDRILKILLKVPE